MAAYGGPQYQVTQQVMNRFAEAIQQSRVDVVPRVVVSGRDGENGATGSSIMEGLLTLLLSDRLGLETGKEPARDRSPDADLFRSEIRQSLMDAGRREGDNKPLAANGDTSAPPAPAVPTRN